MKTDFHFEQNTHFILHARLNQELRVEIINSSSVGYLIIKDVNFKITMEAVKRFLRIQRHYLAVWWNTFVVWKQSFSLFNKSNRYSSYMCFILETRIHVHTFQKCTRYSFSFGCSFFSAYWAWNNNDKF